MSDDDFMDKALARDENTIRDMFSCAAPRYDFLNHLLSFSLDKLWRRTMVQKSRFREFGDDVQVLDLCTGTGDVLFEFLKNPYFKGKIVGLDFSSQMLEIANEKAKKLGVSDRAEFIEANALHTPFKNETFDIITITWGLRNLSDLQLGVQEIYRILKRGGRFLSLEFFRHDDGLSKSISSWYISHVIPFIGRIFSASSAYRYLAESREKFITADDYSKMLLKTGFINVSYKHFICQVNTIHVGEKPR